MAGQVKAINIRVWGVKGGVHPEREPKYLDLGHFSDPDWPLGDVERITAPDPNDFNKEVTIGQDKDEPERPTFSVMSRYTTAKAILLDLARKNCRVDFWAMVGACGNPQNFYEGGEKFVFFPDGQPTNWSAENFGTFGRADSDPTNEELELSARELYELLKLRFAQLATAEAVREVPTIVVCDDVNCGDCGDESDGCQRVLAAMIGNGATPGTKPVLLYSDDGGATWSSQTISTLLSNEDPVDSACVGGDYVVVSTVAAEMHFTSLDELYSDGNNDWFEVDSGFLAAKAPTAIFSADVNHTWLVGYGGYVYFAKDHKVGVVVQDAGVATTQDLLAVHGYDKDNVVAVGESNAVIFTWNGGETWESVTGPAVGEDLGAVWMWSPDIWFVGTGAGGSGKLYYTTNAGLTWTEKSLPSIGITRIYDIEFVNEAEGYLSAAIGGKSVILRTLTGGYDWVVLPEGNKTANIPDNANIQQLAVCEDDSNVVFGAGLGDDGSAGYIVKAAAKEAW